MWEQQHVTEEAIAYVESDVEFKKLCKTTGRVS